MQGTLKSLFEEVFNLDCETMEENKPINVSEANVKVLAFDESLNKDTMAKVFFAIKKPAETLYNIKLKNRKDFEKGVSKNHLFAIYKNDDGKVEYSFVKDLKKGMMLLTKEGFQEIESIQKSKKDYLLDIQTETGNFYTNGILSHNSTMSHAVVTTGGFMLRYAGSTLMRVKKIENIKEGNKDVGIYMNVRNMKNKTGIPWRECEMMLYFNKGFRTDLEYADFIKEFNGDPRLANYVSIGGAYYKSEEFGFSICGKEKFLEWANNFENAEKWQKIKDIITEIISHPTPIDTDIDIENMSEEEIEELKKEGKLKTLEVNKDIIEE